MIATPDKIGAIVGLTVVAAGVFGTRCFRRNYRPPVGDLLGFAWSSIGTSVALYLIYEAIFPPVKELPNEWRLYVAMGAVAIGYIAFCKLLDLWGSVIPPIRSDDTADDSSKPG